MNFIKKLFISTLLLSIYSNVEAQSFSTVSDGICSYAKYRCTPSTFNSSNLNVFEPADWGCFGNNILTITNINFSYIETTGSGTLNLSLTSTSNNVDYVCWGPLSSPRAACAGGLGSPISCGTGSGNETINLTGVAPGQFYVILTRSSATNRPITFSKISGSASVSCTNNSVCGDVDYNATEGSTSGTNIGDAKTYACGTNTILQLRAHNYNTAREHITPAMMSITDINNRPVGSNYVKPVGVNINYCATVGGASQLPLFTLYFLFPQEYISPSQGPQLGYQYCDTYNGSSSENMSFNIYDMASKTSLKSGTWNVVGAGTGGPSCSSDAGGSSCQDEKVNANLITGSALYSCTTCGSALNSSDNGKGTLNISNLPVGVHNITYSWNNGTGCSGTKTKTITITGSGNPNFSYSQSTYCSGQSNPTPTESSTAGTYSASPSGLTINSNNGTINIGSSSAGTYTITKTLGSGGCASTHTESITIGGGNANAGNNKNINCNTNSVTLNGSGGGTYSWSPTTGLSSSTVASPTASPSTTTTYTLTTSQGGCSATDQVTVNVNTTAPTANAGSDKTISCTSTSTTLNGSGGASYSWSPATGLSSTTAASPTASPSSNQTYTLTVTGSNGCTDTDQVAVTVNGTLPTANAGSNKTTSCTSPSATLNGSGGGTYSWSPATGLSSTTVATPTANPPSNQTYTLTVTASNGCTHTDQVTVNVDKSAPNANAGSNKTINCNTNSVTLDGSGGTSYSWSPATALSSTTIANPSANPTSNQTYTLTATGANGCTDTDQVTVNINTTPPTANAGSDAAVSCSSPSTILSGSGGTSYSWSPTSGLSSSTIANPTATPNSTQNYTLTVTGANGCTDTDQVTITVNGNLPTVDAGSNATTTCNNPTTTLNGSGGGTFSWSPATGLSSTTIANPIANPNSSTTYTLTITATNGCTSTDQATVTVDESAPNGDAGANITLDCNTTSSTFTATGGGTYSWSSPNGTFTSSTVNVSSSDTPGDYILTTTGSNGCTNVSTATLTIDQTDPIADAGSAQTYSCGISSLTLDGSASTGTGITYLWTGGNISSGSTTDSPEITSAGTYTLTVTSNNGCTNSESVIITPDNNLPNADAGGNIDITCTSSSVLLDGSGSDTGGDITYLWSTSDGNIVGPNSGNSATADLNGTYTLTVTNTSNNCFASDDVIVNQDTISPIVTYQNNALILSCNLTESTIDASSSSGIGNTYSWNTQDGNIVSGVNSATPTINSAGEYFVTITSSNGCTNNLSPIITVTMDTLSPTILIEDLDTLSCVTPSVLIDASSSSNPINFIWTTNNGNIINGATENIAEVNQAGEYVLVATNANGCSTTKIVLVIKKEDPIAIIEANPIIGETPLEVDFDAINSTGINLIYDWEYLTDNISSNIAFSYIFDEVGDHDVILIVTDEIGCSDTTEIIITVEEVSDIFIPNVFTPNGDNENENFVIENIELFPNNSIVIFNRWGDKVFETSPYTNNWGGRNQVGGVKPMGDELVEGTYFFILQLSPEEKGINGTVELIKD